MGDQWALIIKSRLPKLNNVADLDVAELVKEEMFVNTAEGHGFGDDVYEPTYSKRYANRRKGGSLKPVTLRDKDFALETANVAFDGKGGMISFQSKGNIFRFHNDGTAKGEKMRSIFPKRIESVPKSVRLRALRAGKVALSGK
jgi:hypothetical protein